MKVILLKEVKKLGQKADIKEVPDGYARNYLLPQGLAEILTKHTLQMLEAQKTKKRKMGKIDKQNKARLAKKIDRRKFVIQAKTDESGTLYAALKPEAAAREIKSQGFDVEGREIKLDNSIKKTGKYSAEVVLAGKKAKVTLEIVSM